ncbi:SDR family NAD(P)-dependent oxidoreductase [Streptomyces sp. NPDC001093]|uniref:SDR family NAD(P)-dependent oxidoreductase n=1 Tax=Streptomyces sp. NPDC001093 TaxID=3154376 RepID=UPI00331FCA07
MAPVSSHRIALITGGNRGLGRETASRLAALGMHVLVGSRSAEAGEATARQLTGRGLSALGVQLDVTDPENVRSVAADIGRTYGRLDVLVNNAGVIVEASATRLTAAEIRSVCEVNLLGAATMVHEMLPLLRDSAHPRIVNVSSTTASLSLTAAGTDFGGDAAHRIAYSVSKAAPNMLTLQYARAFAADPELAHIKINAVAPGYVATDMNRGQGTRTVGEGAAVVVEFANLDGDGPTGEFHNDRGPVPW